MADRPNRPIRPRGPGGGRRRRVVIDTAAGRPRPDARQQRGQQDGQTRQKPAQPAAAPTGPVTVESGVTVKDLSQALGVPVPKIITILMGGGVAKTVTQTLADEEVELIASEVEREVTIKHAADEEEVLEVFEDD